MLVLWGIPGVVVYIVLLSRVRKRLGLRRGELLPGPRPTTDFLFSIVGAFAVLMLWPIVLIRWRSLMTYFVQRPERLVATTYDN